MINRTRAAALALTALAVGLPVLSHSASAVTADVPDLTIVGDIVGTSYPVPVTSHLTGVASACLDAGTGAWSATWKMTVDRYQGFNQDKGVTIGAVAYPAAGPVGEPDPRLLQGIVSGNVLAVRDDVAQYSGLGSAANVITGISHHTGATAVRQSIDYQLASDASSNGNYLLFAKGTLSLTLASPCDPNNLTSATSSTTAPTPTSTVSAVSDTPTVPAGAGRFVSLVPGRIFDTRNTARVAPGETIDVRVLGGKGVPESGVTAVVLNVTADDATGPGFVTVWPTGVTMPTASNLNLDYVHQTTPNLVSVPVGSDGKVSIFSSGGAQVIVDVMGYYEAVTTPVVAGRFIGLSPVRLIDTRDTPDTLEAEFVGTLQVAGRANVPSTGVDAVVLNVTATDAAQAGFLTVFPTGSDLPEASNLNLGGAGETRANQVIVKLGTGGQVDVYSSGGTDLIVDVAGYFTDGSSGATSASGLFVPVVPGRDLDTRGGQKPTSLTSLDVRVTGRAGLPTTGVAAVALNATGVDATNAGFVTVWPQGLSVPNASTLNMGRVGQTVPNHAITPVSATGEVSIYTYGGSHLLIDVLGWYTA